MEFLRRVVDWLKWFTRMFRGKEAKKLVSKSTPINGNISCANQPLCANYRNFNLGHQINIQGEGRREVEGPKLATRGGVNGSRSKFISKSIRRSISRKSPQALKPRIWENSYGLAISLQNALGSCAEAKGGNLQNWTAGTGQTGSGYRSDR